MDARVASPREGRHSWDENGNTLFHPILFSRFSARGFSEELCRRFLKLTSRDCVLLCFTSDICVCLRVWGVEGGRGGLGRVRVPSALPVSTAEDDFKYFV